MIGGLILSHPELALFMFAAGLFFETTFNAVKTGNAVKSLIIFFAAGLSLIGISVCFYMFAFITACLGTEIEPFIGCDATRLISGVLAAVGVCLSVAVHIKNWDIGRNNHGAIPEV